MKTMSEIVLARIEETRQRFHADTGTDHKNEKLAFINWYVANHDAPLAIVVYDLSQYYLHLSEATILTYLNEKE